MGRRYKSAKDRIAQLNQERAEALAKRAPAQAKEIQFHKVDREGVQTFREQQRGRQMSDTNISAAPSGAVLAPLVRNWVRVLCGMALGWVVTFLVQKGYLPVDAITPEDLQGFLASDTGKAIVGAISLAVLGMVDAIWLKARKTGGAT
jgi:hypothetical protein